VGEDGGRQIVAAKWAAEHIGIRARNPAELIGVLTLLAGDDVMATTEKQDRLCLRVEEVDVRQGTVDHDPPPGLEFRVHVGALPPIGAASLQSVTVGYGPSLSGPAIGDHAHVRGVAESVAERPAQLQLGPGDDDDEGLLGVPYGDFGTRVTLHTPPPCCGSPAYSRVLENETFSCASGPLWNRLKSMAKTPYPDGGSS